MLQYKANLGVLNGRYGDLERRVLLIFAQDPNLKTIWLPGGLRILLMYLLMDGLIALTGQTSGVAMRGVPSSEEFRITDAGRVFIDRWVSAQQIP